MALNRVQSCILVIIAFLIAALLYCSLDPMAGGTGAGNPGITTVSVYADTSYIPSGLKGDVSLPINNREKRILPVIDDDSLVLLVSSMTITVRTIKLLLDKPEKSYELLEGFNDNLCEDDSESITINGPFVFDVLTGLSTPSIGTLEIPAAEYTGIKLHINNNADASDYAIEANGTFNYKDVIREFTIKMEENVNAHYNFDGQAYQVSEGDSVKFLLFLDADEWLSSVSLKGYLDNNEISLNPSGNLVIDKSTNTEPYKDFKKAFKSNMVKSGYLHIIPLIVSTD